MRSAVIIAFPVDGKGNPVAPVAKYFASYAEGREESRKMRDAKTPHEFWSSTGGMERRVGSSSAKCINQDLLHITLKPDQANGWVKKASEEQKRAHEDQVKNRLNAVDKRTAEQIAQDDAKAEQEEARIEAVIESGKKSAANPGVNFEASRPVLTPKQKAKRDARLSRQAGPGPKAADAAKAGDKPDDEDPEELETAPSL